MTIAVRFPDGSVRNIPAQLKEIPDASSPDTQPSFERVPLNCDPVWRFQRVGEEWYATPRSGSLSMLKPILPEWWRTVRHMDDSAPRPGRQRQSQNRRGPIDTAA
ncbi:hypothetical protein EBBID32_20550 [Sphingobium indicum BiD32]|uniref:Uncharacterized protein n=1 Tax=Sphingobium indicum BiD32 TaxID=1301087 RepID=N1MQ10_9SPHN|nr:hypothetical protein [Sphingobium indicum]CCW17707.1 hypothetical protein EBBID32_20550 [Sphingobium indicum BiD32]